MGAGGRERGRPPLRPTTGIMTTVVRQHLQRVVLGAVLLLALAASVYAASRERAISLSATPIAQSASAGSTARWKVDVKRDGGFNRRVAIHVHGLPAGSHVVWQLPSGARLARAYRRGPTVILPARHRRAILAVRLPAGTAPGSFRPHLHSYGHGVRATKRLALDVRPAATVSPAPAPAFSVRSAQPGRAVLQGDETSWTIELERTGGFTAPVAMDVVGLPAGASARWSSDGPVAGDRVTLTVATGRATPVGSHELTVTGQADGMAESAVATLDVLETKPFAVAGDASSPLTPGASSPLALTVTNPYDFPLRLERLDVSVADETSNPGCSGTANYAVEQLGAVYPLVLPPGTSALAELVPAGALPRVSMRAAAVNQDACKGAEIRLVYDGVAGK